MDIRFYVLFAQKCAKGAKYFSSGVGSNPTSMDETGVLDYTDIHKKARHETSLMSGKIEICVRRL